MGKKWHVRTQTRHHAIEGLKSARRNYTEDAKYSDNDGDPCWGSSWSRIRHEKFGHFFDDDALAANDIAVAWGSLSNTIPRTMMAIAHTFQDASLLQRVRREADNIGGDRNKSLAHAKHKDFTSASLLSAIFAETLRLHVSVFIPVIPQYKDLEVGDWRIPQGTLTFINSGLAHRNEEVWNTQSGAHPLDSFWADRFLVYPDDPSSGPVKPGHAYYQRQRLAQPPNKSGGEPYFSLDGLDSSWIPFGGGRNIRPGRFLGKSIMAFSLAILARDFDIELLNSPIPLSNNRFGVAVELPTKQIPFRIRRRQ